MARTLHCPPHLRPTGGLAAGRGWGVGVPEPPGAAQGAGVAGGERGQRGAGPARAACHPPHHLLEPPVVLPAAAPAQHPAVPGPGLLRRAPAAPGQCPRGPRFLPPPDSSLMGPRFPPPPGQHWPGASASHVLPRPLPALSQSSVSSSLRESTGFRAWCARSDFWLFLHSRASIFSSMKRTEGSPCRAAAGHALCSTGNLDRDRAALACSRRSV